MDVVLRESIQIPHSVVVSGLTGSETDEEVSTFLQKYGSINRYICLDDPKSDYHKNMIVEFAHETAMQTLEPLLPLQFPSMTQAGIVYELKALGSVYSIDARSKATKMYMEQLSEIARLSGNSLGEMLKEELKNLVSSAECAFSQSLQTDPESSAPQSPTPQKNSTIKRNVPSSETPQSVMPTDPMTLTSANDPSKPLIPSIFRKNLIDLNPSQTFSVSSESTATPLIDVNPPAVQRVVVEHVVRSNDNSPQFASPSRLRAFSGKSPRPSHEADYDTWRASVEILIRDPSVSDLHCTHRVLDSLLPPASEMIKHLSPQSSPSTYLKLLDSAYGTVEDGDELYARFISTFQNDGELPSVFLQRLHTALSKTMRRGGVSAPEFDQQLLKQFCRGCWENTLIVDLQLEQKKEKPPTFAELLLLLRTEEDKQAAKMTRMRQHFSHTKSGACKQRAMSQVHLAHDTNDLINKTDLEMLKQQIADLSIQVKSIVSGSQKPKQPKQQKAKSVPLSVTHEAHVVKPKTSYPSTFKANGRPRPWYCFHCGEDGHVVSVCDKAPNPSLVAAKKKQLKEKQAAWEASNASQSETHLN
ncbi:zinc finger CCHC domain-containing protein 18-like [Xiphophorus hellerii]|uniref:zinc finger CCHC domain-containing protein 18-like n=1 Tax=Xiphophorus hellerii TaxID=8084 RepID=UPI0013B3D7F2|nr:zinc finger CCHC domain-containing protein 18-like [Xiphophorus hellerii]XP_032446031.1 zinc finger CCHC domain-containing protein 18-like [Xiphophorus hellerii]